LYQALARSYGARMHSLNRPFGRYFSPAVIHTTQSGTASAYTSAAPIRSPWLKTTALDVEHYGIKTWFTAPGSTSAKYWIDYTITGYVQFRFPQ
jgi:hypothetical protein